MSTIDREAGAAAGTAGPGVAGHQRRRGVRPLVRRPLRRAVCRGRRSPRRSPRPPSTRRSPNASSRTRGCGHLADRRDRTAAAVRLPLASVRGRPGRRLRPGADDAGRVHPGRDARRRAAHHHRIRFRRHPRGAPRAGVRGQLRGLGDPDRPGAQVHRRHCGCERAAVAWARRFSTRSGTPIGCASSFGSAIWARVRHRKSPASFRSPGRRPASICGCWSRAGWSPAAGRVANASGPCGPSRWPGPVTT